MLGSSGCGHKSIHLYTVMYSFVIGMHIANDIQRIIIVIKFDYR